MTPLIREPVTSTAPPTGARHEAADRILRLFTRFTGGGYLVYLVLLLPAIVSQAHLMDRWWTPTAAVAVFGSGLALVAASFLPDTRILRAAGGTAALVYLLALAAWPLAWNGLSPADGAGIWLSTFPGLASLAALAAWRPAYAFAHVVIACTGVHLVNSAARSGHITILLIPDIAFTVMFCTLFVGAAAMALRTGRVLDATTDATHAAAAAAAAQHARTVERERFDALIHDGVMSTLLSASRQGATPSIARQSAATMRQLDALRSGPGPHERFDEAEVLSHLRTAATEVDEDATLQMLRHPESAALSMPADAVRAMGAALAEALRNSIAHAGPDAHRAVVVTIAPDRVGIRIADNGIGFDPDSIPAHRLGLAVSIRARMGQVPGGSALIDSRPADGTRIHLTWRASCRT
ncbi:sensor histidine kinase [Rhodococcus tukisamuensis]|uniref:Signal transduction histidine kinase n=1 Tax=Rhodococcus tukisamuensis TaxID=168276 RepID=A0A1G6SEP0_9NOCA|nr:ATP-binding protein [Rhodococcus tukisamuensis]SDD14646.1 Signal transduction histidine kinase [Rhodococcus tukisamuensis]